MEPKYLVKTPKENPQGRVEVSGQSLAVPLVKTLLEQPKNFHAGRVEEGEEICEV